MAIMDLSALPAIIAAGKSAAALIVADTKAAKQSEAERWFLIWDPQDLMLDMARPHLQDPENDFSYRMVQDSSLSPYQRAVQASKAYQELADHCLRYLQIYVDNVTRNPGEAAKAIIEFNSLIGRLNAAAVALQVAQQEAFDQVHAPANTGLLDITPGTPAWAKSLVADIVEIRDWVRSQKG